jgi:DNA primase large subunit
MELDIKPRLNLSINNGINESKGIDDGLSLNLYKSVPFGQLTLEECEDLFRQRLEALHIMETSKSGDKSIHPLDVTNQLRNIKSFVYKTNCLILNKNDKLTQRLDQLSHMLLRLYCVYRSDLWPWFKTNEKRLFLFRLRDQATSYSGAQLEGILKSFNFRFIKVVGNELSELIQENLIIDRNKNDVFKVRFTDALRFIANRSVSLKDGYALLSRHDIISVVGDAFERHLEGELAYARQHLKLEDLQVRQLVESMNLVHQDFSEKIEEQNRLRKRGQNDENKRPFAIEIEDLDNLVKNHYPPCMRYLHETLVTDHHLKHTGRLHYGAFLRAGQVDLDTAVEFWRKEFTKRIPNEKFERDYKYNIRHLYGKEGSNKNGLSCFSCDKIINSVPGTAEKHGCPFKHFDDTHLKNMLNKHGLKEVDIESIVMKRNQADPKAACTAYFEYSKGHEMTDLVRNPIQFYYESRRMANRPKQEELSDQCDQQVSGIPPGHDDPEMEFDD